MRSPWPIVAGLVLILGGFVFYGITLHLHTGPHVCGRLICTADITRAHRQSMFDGAAAAVWVGASISAAGWGRYHGYSFFALFVAALFLTFPLVTLVVTIAAGPRSTSAATPNASSYA